MPSWQSPSRLMAERSRERATVRGTCEVYSESSRSWYPAEVLHSVHATHEVHVRYAVNGASREKWLLTHSKHIRKLREKAVDARSRPEPRGFMAGFGAAVSKTATSALKAVNSTVPLGISRAVDLPAFYVGKSAEELHTRAEKVGWLHKEGHSLATVARMDTFKKLWCLLLPGTTPDGSYENLASSDRWLVYYPEKTSTVPEGAFVLPCGGYTVRPQARAREWAFRLDIASGPSANVSYILATDTAESHFSWMETFEMGTQSVCRLPNPAETAVHTELLDALPADVGGTGADFDSANPVDAGLLQGCWAGFGNAADEFVVKGNEWKDFGFQRDDPVSDLRACGRLALLQLVYFLERHPSTARGMCAAQVQDDDITNAYPWATASVAITRMLCMFMDLVQPFGMVCRWEACRKNSWHFMSSAETFHEVYCIMFECLDAEFKQTGGTYMTFPVVLASMREKFSHVLLETFSDETPVQLRSRVAAAFALSAGRTSGAPVPARLRRPSMYPKDMFHLTLSTSPDVPVLFKLLTARLSALDADTTDRICSRRGDEAMVEYLQHELTQGENASLVLQSCADVHTLATLFERFLLQLPEPIIPPAKYDALYAIGDNPSPEELSNFIDALPPVNQAMLRQLVSHLQQYQESVDNLAVCFAPALIRHTDPGDVMQHRRADERFVRNLLAKLPLQDRDEHTDALLMILTTAARSIGKANSGRTLLQFRAQAKAHRKARLKAETEHAAHLDHHASIDAELETVHAQIQAHEETFRAS